MPRKCKFDGEWEQALSLLNDADAAQARSIIENYQSTGEMPSELEQKFQMILLLVKPIIDRRRRASQAARLRRQRIKADSTASLQPVYGCAPEEAHPSTPPAQKANDSAQISQEMKQRKKAKHRKWSRNKHKKNLQMKELIHTFVTSK